MDTRFWGPSGWFFLHNLANNYSNHPSKEEKNNYKIFFNTLPVVLPCIYCRRSLKSYYEELPLDDHYLKNREHLSEWLYLIHNKVNDKLIGQGLIEDKKPSLDRVMDKYNIKKKNKCNMNKCLNFLYAIGMNYDSNSIITKKNYEIFFRYLIIIFPNLKIKQNLLEFQNKYPINNFLKSKETLMKWIYSIDKIVNKECMCYKDRYTQVAQYRANCKGTKGEKPTCRIPTKFILP